MSRKSKRAENESSHSEKQPKKRSFLKTLLLTLLAVLFAGGAVVAVGGAWYVSRLAPTLPSDEEIMAYQANEASVVYDRKGRVISELFVENRRPVQLAKVSRWMVMSILAAEDSDFYSHKGIRPLSIARSFLVGDGGQGASTITQQLARNLFLTLEKSIERKAKEAMLTLRIERLYSKDKILESYLNAIFWGHGSWGISSAARAYFDKKPADLTLAEASLLAGIVAAPEKYSPLRHLERAKQRQKYVLSRMVTLGWITREEADTTAQTELKFNEKTRNRKAPTFTEAPHFVSWLLFNHLLPKYGTERIYKGGLRIYTTLDLDLQKAAETAMSKLKPEGALVAMDPETGNVLALVGGKDFEKSKFNRATQAYRPSGSAFKPVVYTAALEAGYRPNDHILDQPLTLKVPNSPTPLWSPRNFSHKYAGEEPLYTALAASHNTPVVRLTYLVGVDAIVDMGRRLGITSPYLTSALSVGLGVASVTPLEMAVVFSTFANNGARVTPHFIKEIRGRDNTVLETTLPTQEQVIEPRISLMARTMMEQVMNFGTGARGRIPNYQCFGKTGTTNDYSDAWFAGAIPGLTTIVYAGNDDYTSLGRNATGGAIVLPIWSEFTKAAAAILGGPKRFTTPKTDLVSVKLSRKSGYLAAPGEQAVVMLLPAKEVPQTTKSNDPVSSLILDPNAPKLIMLPDDEKYVALPEDIPEQTIKPVLAQNPGSDTLTLDSPRPQPMDQKTIESRYDDLLKQYNLKD